MADETECPECKARNYRVLPGRGTCSICLKLRDDYLLMRWGATLLHLAKDDAEHPSPIKLADDSAGAKDGKP